MRACVGGGRGEGGREGEGGGAEACSQGSVSLALPVFP